MIPGRRNAVVEMIAELGTQPGRWAEVCRYPPSRAKSAHSRGSMLVKRHKDLRVQYAVEVNADTGESVLYLRVEENR